MIPSETLVYFAGDILHHCHTDHGLDISIVYLMAPSLGWMQTIPACTDGQSFLHPQEINLVCGLSASNPGMSGRILIAAEEWFFLTRVKRHAKCSFCTHALYHLNLRERDLGSIPSEHSDENILFFRTFSVPSSEYVHANKFEIGVDFRTMNYCWR